MGVVISEERIYVDFDISVNDYQFNTVEPLLFDTSLLWTVLLVLKILTITIWPLWTLHSSSVMWTTILADCLFFVYINKIWLLNYLSIEL